MNDFARSVVSWMTYSLPAALSAAASSRIHSPSSTAVRESPASETPPEKGLLHESLLAEFMLRRPKTRDEWFRKIPQHCRTSVDPRQVGRYLDRTLEIIREHE
jgi:hypothetical protein